METLLDLDLAPLVVAGRGGDPARLGLWAARGATVHDAPRSLRALYARAGVAALPLWGGGTPIKTLEALARGVRVVASPHAAQEVTHLAAVTVARGPSWRDAVEAALDDPLAGTDEARAWVRAHRGVASVTARVDRWLAQ